MSPITQPATSEPDAAGEGFELYFGGPDRPPRRLRNVLKVLVDAQPAGGAFDWVTYYFRDLDLARSLIAASARGVRVRLLVERETRSPHVNDAVIALLAADGLNGGFRVRPKQRFGRLGGHLHTKLYAFSHPKPSVLIGSFNPSGNEPEDPRIIADIGDQDRGHNLLVRLFDLALVTGARDHARALWRERGVGRMRRFHPKQNAAVRGTFGDFRFFPRIAPRVLPAFDGAREIVGAVSHLKPGALTRAAAGVVRRGGRARLVTHDTERRAPTAMIDQLKSSGVEVSRWRHPEALPMHAKFLIVEGASGVRARLGSLNDNPTSVYFNHEIAFETSDRALSSALKRRFDEIEAEALNGEARGLR